MFEKAWAEVERLIDANAKHRKGFRLKDIHPLDILHQANGELNELRHDPDDVTEMADLLGVLIHYSIKLGWTPAQLESEMLSKFAIRFSP